MPEAFLPNEFVAQLDHHSTSSARACRRITLNHAIMKIAKLSAGDLLLLSKYRTLDQPFALGIAWPSLELDSNAISVASTALLTIGAGPGDVLYVSPIPLSRSNGTAMFCLTEIQEANTVTIRELDEPLGQSIRLKGSSLTEGLNTRDPPLPQWLPMFLKEKLVDIQFMTRHQIFQVKFQGKMRTFSVSSVTPVNIRGAAWNVGWDTKVILESLPPAPPKIKPVQNISPYALVGGLDKQIQEIRDLIELPLSRPDLYHQFGLKPPRGILLHGPPGTGKTHLARVIADASGASLITVSGPELSSALHGETESKLRAVFEEARALSPSIVVLDEVDAICPKREDSGAGVEARVVTTLLTLMDGMDLAKELTGEMSTLPRVVVVATTNRPNAIDPALRRPGRFDREIEIGVPDVRARLSILNVLLTKIPHSILPDELQNVAMRSHGHVGADLAAVVREAGSRAIKRWTLQGDQSNSTPCLTYVDLLDSISTIRPSALRELFVESPSVRWSDIGGQALVKQKLKESVEWPLLHWRSFARLGVTPPKGVLLYGPPGCSKTLTAKALATESGINFISVKGPELLSKYVGESERAVRDIFRKARGAAPSIIFFDEIDALATSRSNGETSSHQGVLTTLLTEMDGIQDLVGVIVVAATNRPHVLDPAMMRPGRLDRILYVGPPDLDSRREILRIRTSKMAVEPSLSIEDLAWMTEGCSGAEIAAMCQEAALRTMKRDIDSPFVSQDDFVYAAKNIRRQITPIMISKFEQWRDSSGVPVV